MLANISLYWFTGAIGSSFWPYYAPHARALADPRGETVNVPTGYAEFPKEILLAAALHRGEEVHRHPALDRMPKGGHFAALEQPQALADDIIAFFGALVEGNVVAAFATAAIVALRASKEAPVSVR